MKEDLMCINFSTRPAFVSQVKVEIRYFGAIAHLSLGHLNIDIIRYNRPFILIRMSFQHAPNMVGKICFCEGVTAGGQEDLTQGNILTDVGEAFSETSSLKVSKS
jgi:hypothetical protein